MANKNENKGKASKFGSGPKKRTTLSAVGSVTEAKNLNDIVLSPIIETEEVNTTVEESNETVQNDSEVRSVVVDNEINSIKDNNEIIEREHRKNNEEIKKDVKGVVDLSYYLEKRPDMRKEKLENVMINASHRDNLKLLAALEGSQINIIMYNVLEDFFEKHGINEMIEAINKKKNKMKV